MIVGHGIDIVEVDRIAEKISSAAFLQKVFSPDEITFCEAKKNKAEHYAARFAAKEAFLKATGFGLLAGLNLYEIEIKADEAGKPFLVLQGSFKSKAIEHNWNTIHVSLSHTKALACASVIIEQ